MKSRLFPLLLLSMFCACLSATAEDLSGSPDPVAKKVDLHIYAIWEGINSASNDVILQQMDRLHAQFGEGNAFYHPGFSFIFANGPALGNIARLAAQKHLSIGVIDAVQTHSQGAASYAFFDQDLRAYQWRMKDNNWTGFYTGKNGAGAVEIDAAPRDFCVPSPSRYSPLIAPFFFSRVHDNGRQIKRVMDANPGVITCVNAVIEEELAIATASVPTNANDWLADYSPFAVTEFRDWLRHTGIYDDANGKYAGQGAPASITGDFEMIDGVSRSPFYDDPDPDSANGTGQSFNQTFGTHFKTWDLKYWDLKAFPHPITDKNFKPMPVADQPGFTADGFDAPRQVDHGKFWHAWSWDVFDEDGKYPPGNPAHPAFGFRQCEVQHYVSDVFDILAAEGIPRDIMYAHQIPGEQVSAVRCRSGADPVWTGYLPASQSVGVTNFGWFNPERATQYADLTPGNHGWGIFEWHPWPNADPKGMPLYNRAMRELIVYSKSNCRYLFAGWWHGPGEKRDPIFPLDDSTFAKAIHDFMATTPDNPPPEPADPGGDVGKIR